MRTDKKEKQRLINANKILIFAKWFYFAALILTSVISNITPGTKSLVNFSPLKIVVIGSTVYIYNFLFYLYFRKAERRPLREIKVLSLVNLTIDQLFVTVVIYFAGGLTSISFLYYFYSIVASGFFFSLLSTALLATVVAVLYGGLILLQFYNIIPYISRYNIAYEAAQAHNASAVFPNLWAVITSIFIVGAFIGLMAKSMRLKEREANLAKDKVESIISDLIDGLIFINKDNLIEMINPQAEKLLQISAKKFVGRSIPEIKKSFSPIIKSVLEQENGLRGRIITPPNREDQPILITSSEVRDENGHYIGTAKIIRDVSREKHLDNMKNEFITIAGHQIRTPLSALKGALNLLRNGDYGPVSAEQKNVLDQSYDYNERLIHIINDMLEASSAEEGKYEYKFEPEDIRKFLQGVRESFKVEAENKKQKLTVTARKNLAKVSIDSFKLKLALSTLISNAITYTPKRGHIDILCESKDKNTIQIVVRDSGIGIPKDEQDKVFTKFFRASNALRVDTEGNGLELFVAKNIIEKHGGKIWLESMEGTGTAFYIELPVKQK